MKRNLTRASLLGMVISLSLANFCGRACCERLSAFTPETLWTRTYGGTSADYGVSMQRTLDAGYIIAGYTSSSGAGAWDVYLIKTDADGDILWTKTYGGSADDRGYSVQQTVDEGYIIAGYTSSLGAGDYDVYLIKTDADGDILWTKTYGGTADDRGYSVRQTLDAGYILTGYTSSSGAGSWDVYLIKTNTNGDILWTMTYGGEDADFGQSVEQTVDGGYVVAGYTYSFGAGAWDVYLVKTDASGIPIWTKTLGGADWDIGLSVKQTSDGGYIVTGYTGSFGAGHNDVYLVRTAADGTTLWTRTYGGMWWDVGVSVQQTSDGGYIVTGYTYSFGAGLDDVYLIKTEPDGDTLWTRTYGGADYDRGSAVRQTSDGAYVVAGCTRSFGAGDYDVYLLRIIPGIGVEEVQSSQEIFFTPACGPNPFTDRTSVCYELPETGRVRIVIYNFLGQEVTTLLNAEQAVGVHTVTWDGRDSFQREVSSGPYFLRFAMHSTEHSPAGEGEVHSVTKKLFLLR